MRLLIVTHQYLPNPNPRALRWSAIAEYWAAQGHEVDVVCGVPGEESAHNGRLRVHRVGIGWRERLRSRYGRGSAQSGVRSQESGVRSRDHHSPTPGSTAGRTAPLHRMKRGLLSMVRGANAFVAGQLCWPDSASGWYRPALRFCRERLQRADYDALVTVSNPFTSHRVGLALKRAAPSLPWLVDVGDPFSVDDKVRVNNHRLYAQRNRRFEAAVMRTADAVAIVTESMTDLYRRSFPESAARMHAVQPLCTAPVTAGPSPRRNDRPLRLAYFGTLYRGVRSPQPLLRLFRQLLTRPGCANAELHFYGNPNGCEGAFDSVQDLAGRNVHRHGTVSREAAYEAMHNADVLVNLGNDLPYGLPSKVVEYAATGKPILNLAVIPADTSAAFLQSYPAAWTVSADDVARDRVAIADVATFLQHSPGADRKSVERLLRPHRVEAVAENYARLQFSPERDSAIAA